MKIFLDMDGVIVDFFGGVQKWYNVELDGETHSWSFDYEAFGMTISEFWDGLTDEFWENLEFYPWAKTLINACSLSSSQEVYLLSAPTWAGAGGKQRWIRKNLPDFLKGGKYIFTPSKDLLAAPDRILIDDNDGNYKSWLTHGGKGILFPQPWNDNRPLRHNRMEYTLQELNKYLDGRGM